MCSYVTGQEFLFDCVVLMFWGFSLLCGIFNVYWVYASCLYSYIYIAYVTYALMFMPVFFYFVFPCKGH